MVQSTPAHSDPDQGKSAEGRDGQTHPAGCACRALNIRLLKLAHGLHLLLALPPCAVENGHSRSQSGAAVHDTYKAMKEKELSDKGKREGAGLESSSTSKDYLCHPANVNFATFSQRRNGENLRGLKKMKGLQTVLWRASKQLRRKELVGTAQAAWESGVSLVGPK